jgi:hypothetical protein
MRISVTGVVVTAVLAVVAVAAQETRERGAVQAGERLAGHPVRLDGSGRLLSWPTGTPADYDRFLRLRWSFITDKAPLAPGPAPRSSHPAYYFYCAYKLRDDGGIENDPFMNDVGEKVPNWFESARLFAAYTGDDAVMRIARGLVDYAIEHGTSDASFAWPRFPYTTTNAGDLEFRGFTSAKRFVEHEVQLDHAAEMGLTYYRMHLYTGEPKYLEAALRVADALAAHVRTGTAERSVWPYRVVLDSGRVTAEYGANWTGAWQLFGALVRDGRGRVDAYRRAMAETRAFLLAYPMRTGYWTDGHSDTPVVSHTYRSNLSASNMTLAILDDAALDADWRAHVPALIGWTETHFVFRTADGEPATQWGAHVVGEQDEFNHKMDYQTARYAAACARWYGVTGDEAYREKALRSMNWVTYCNTDEGVGIESPVSTGISSWWSDEYGEAPRMVYHVLAGVPEWAPPRQNHVLYSAGVLRRVVYAPRRVAYEPTDADGTEYLRVAFAPGRVTVGATAVGARSDTSSEGYVLRPLGGGDYALTIRRTRPGAVVVE